MSDPNSTDYEQFLRGKYLQPRASGFPEVRAEDLSPHLFPFQRHAVAYALRRGRAALFEECGMGKTLQELEYSRVICERTRGDMLILTPLAVASQTAEEAAKFGIEARVCRSQEDVRPGISIANYERLHLFDARHFVGVVLDESSILKSYMGATKRALLEMFAATPYRLACTATPAPNDHMELGNHAEFLGVMPSNEMLARWFINDTTHFGRYRLKGHAAKDFWEWVATWAMCLSRPSDIGFSDAGFELPPLHTHEHCIEVDVSEGAEGTLFRVPDLSATGLHREMRRTTAQRAERAAQLALAEPEEPWVIWCNTNYESEAIAALIPGAVEVRGSDSPDAKERALVGFAHGDIRVIITKPSIAGFGLNWQHCARAAFVGLSYSFEAYYQAVRRIWRFGQARPVEAHIITASTESESVRAVMDKQRAHQHLQSRMAQAIRSFQAGAEDGARVLRFDAGSQRPTVPSWLLSKCSQEAAA